MSPIEWYYAHRDEQAGPIPSAELKQLAAAGELLPDDLVWREGMEEWVAARNVKGLFEGTLPKAAEVPPKTPEPLADGTFPSVGHENVPPNGRASSISAATPTRLDLPGQTAVDRFRRRGPRHLFDIVLDRVRAQFNTQFVDSTTKIFVTCGHYTLYLAMLVSLSVALILDNKNDKPNTVLLGVGALLILCVLQYAASRFCDALDRLNRTTGGTISSTAFLDCFALLNIVAGLAALLGSTLLAISNGAYLLILFGLVVFIVCQYVAVISLNPNTLSLSVNPEARAGEEAIGLLVFLLKTILRLAPVAFGAGVVCGTVVLLYACCQVLADAKSNAAEDTAFAATVWIICFAALPFLAYLVFLFFYLLVDVIRAALSIPGKLDTRPEKDQEESSQ